jgi:hypothetical protein
MKHPVRGGYKYGNLAFQVGGVSDETVKYDHGFYVTRTIEWLQWKLQTRPLIREGAPQKQDRKFQTATFWQEVISGHKLQSGLDIKTYWLTVRHKVTSTSKLGKKTIKSSSNEASVPNFRGGKVHYNLKSGVMLFVDRFTAVHVTATGALPAMRYELCWQISMYQYADNVQIEVVTIHSSQEMLKTLSPYM